MTKEKQTAAIYHVNRLYRYRSMKSRELEGIFTNQEIYLPNPTFFNDPFECRPNLIVHEGRLSKERYIRESVRRARINGNLLKHQEHKYITNLRMILNDIESMNKIYEDFIIKIGVYCLSAINDDILMWSHYAEGHRGMCLEFDTTKNVLLFEDRKSVV
jgi:hypothetical protein